MAYKTSYVESTWSHIYEPEITVRSPGLSTQQVHEKYGVAETILLNGLNRTTTFFVELLYEPGVGDWSLSSWWKASQRRGEADRIIRALL